MPILTDSPKQLFDLYSLLTPENKGLFLRMIGGISPAEHTFLFMSGQTVLEQYRFNEMIFRETTHKFFPVIIQHAAKLVKEMPSASVEELAEALFEQAGHATFRKSNGQGSKSSVIERWTMKGLSAAGLFLRRIGMESVGRICRHTF